MSEQREQPATDDARAGAGEPLSAELREAINEKAAIARTLGTVWSGFYAYDVERLLDEVDRLRAELAAALPFVREVAEAHLSLVDEYDVIIKVSPGRAAWVLSRARALLAQVVPDSGDPA